MRFSNGMTVCGYRQAVGFSLVEVMVALIVMSVGLLGIAKMQALAISGTTSARTRSLAALEASSLASTMNADRAYWANVTVDPAVQFSAGKITATGDPTLQPNASCPCTPPQLASGDLTAWVADLNLQLPAVQGTVSCPKPPAGSGATPISCTISLNWTERQVVSTAQQTSVLAPINYTLYVNP
jgi:type IV pilus assembly protein PilV